ncbi:hypothetical protein Q0590_12295 [Rhodocytophaga aerolata]|uniref:Glycoside hydrolase family 5 domain-containing protein n=1 Tax=Rhodocytophaga aerolata TaxID=455078 RepID=A0ABT8R6T2_9BACT|nr:cellulase family glycosylhydrolase [Rhodocytophaga aerolata]MDO1447039.1 hypothetical protein [Rhodocytophaga aerolata]
MKQLILACIILLTGSSALPPSKPISLHPENPHYFLFRGKPTILITSGEHYGAVLNLDFDYITYLNALQKDGLNYTRIFTGSYVEDPGAFNISKNTLAPANDRYVAPWIRSNMPGYDNGGNKFDLTQWDQSYFTRLKDFITEAGKRGIVVEVTLFSSLYGWSEGWKSSPLNPKNNINRTDTMVFYKVQTLGNGNLLAHQEKMVRKIVQELKEFDNVIYEIQNEPWADNPKQVATVSKLDTAQPEWQTKVEAASDSSLAWQKYMAAAIKDEEKNFSAQHLIAQNVTNFAYKLPSTDPNISIINFHYARPEAVSYNYNLNKVIGFDESGFAGNADSTYRRQAWRFIMAGGGLFNNLDYSFTVQKPDGTDKQEAPGGGSVAFRKNLYILKKFMENLDFIHLKPDTMAAAHVGQGRVYALSKPGKEYAFYLENLQTSTLDLQLPAGKYTVNWTDPASGTKQKPQQLTHTGGRLSVSIPGNNAEYALHIHVRR